MTPTASNSSPESAPASLAQAPGSATRHEHVCQKCGYIWTCEDPEWGDRPFSKCGVTIAAKSNGEGPWCLLCYHTEMAIRYMLARGRVTPNVQAHLQPPDGNGGAQKI